MFSARIAIPGSLVLILLVAAGLMAQPTKQAEQTPAVQPLTADDVAMYIGGDDKEGFAAGAWGDGVVFTAKWWDGQTVCLRGNVGAEKVKAWFDATADLRTHDGESSITLHVPWSYFVVRLHGKPTKIMWDEWIAPGVHAQPSEGYIGMVGAWSMAKARLTDLCWSGDKVDFEKDAELQQRTKCKTIKDLRNLHP